MSQPTSQEPPDTPDKISPSDTLPEVSPPSAGFLVQLFVIPGIIVLVIVMVWLLFNWLAFMGGDPQSYLAEMRQNKANSWQQAYNLSEELRQNEQHRHDAVLAASIADFLGDLLDQPLPPATGGRQQFQRDPRSEEIRRRGFLCKTLGEFYVTDAALPVLIRAASTHDEEDDLRVRLAALEAIALLAENAKDRTALQDPALMALLLEASQNPDHKIRLRAAFGLAAVGSDEAVGRLQQMLDEPQHVDVHYNVATGLARHGNIACIDMLQEMLNPDEPRSVADEPSDDARQFKRTMILLNGLKAIRRLAEVNGTADLSSLIGPVQKLADSALARQVRVEAKLTLAALQQR